jgi:hypothetical protein
MIRLLYPNFHYFKENEYNLKIIFLQYPAVCEEVWGITRSGHFIGGVVIPEVIVFYIICQQ